jgi:hypothetical protein
VTVTFPVDGDYQLSSCALSNGDEVGPTGADGNLSVYSFAFGFNLMVHYVTPDGRTIDKLASFNSEEDSPALVVLDLRTFTFSGSVRTAEGLPVPGVTVDLSNTAGGSVTGFTDSSGFYSLVASPGSWRVSLYGSGSAALKLPSRWTLDDSPGVSPSQFLDLSKDVSIDYVLPAAHKVTVRVQDETGNSIQGAIGRAFSSCGSSVTVTFPVDGDYQLSSCALSNGDEVGPTGADGNLSVYSFAFGFNLMVHYVTSDGRSIDQIVLLDGRLNAPTAVSVTDVSTNSAKVRWTQPTKTWGERISDYYVEVSSQCSAYVDKAQAPFIAVPHSAFDGNLFNLNSLKPGAHYCLRVSGVNGQGVGDPSEIIQFDTLSLTPSSPKSLSVKNKSGSILLSWVPVSNAQASSTSDYRVELSKDGKTWTKLKKTVSRSTNLLIAGLKKKTTYFFRVSAINIVGSSAPSKSLKIRTS